jgi:malate dehydrogenase (oxaloacetate-decarboxylating)
MNWAKEEIALETNEALEKGKLGDVLKGADVFLGMSGPGVLNADMVKGMAPGSIVFAMANPTPEIFPDDAKSGGAAVIATGRSDFPNQINNCLGFPGLFRGALDVRASTINEEMKLAAAYAIASLIPDSKLTPELIIPESMDPRVVPVVAESVAQAAKDSGVAGL